eukprot:scaffold24583_cov72-Skeletonema_marinoi.AAC.2
MYKVCPQRRSVYEAWGKGQTMQRMHKPSSERRSVQKARGKVKLCSSEGCTNYAQKGGVCCSCRHGAKVEVKKCSSEGCANQVKRGGVCIKHGAQFLPKLPHKFIQ